jgi:uncharacterized protein YsxB (DUF464 family)
MSKSIVVAKLKRARADFAGLGTRRAKLRLSPPAPLDCGTAKDWYDRAVPLHVVINTMREVFSRKQPHERAVINSLQYFKREIEKAFAEHQKNRVGTSDAAALTERRAEPEVCAALSKMIVGFQNWLKSLEKSENIYRYSLFAHSGDCVTEIENALRRYETDADFAALETALDAAADALGSNVVRFAPSFLLDATMREMCRYFDLPSLNLLDYCEELSNTLKTNWLLMLTFRPHFESNAAVERATSTTKSQSRL